MLFRPEQHLFWSGLGQHMAEVRHLQCADMQSEPTWVLDLQPCQLLLHLSQKALLAVRRTDARERVLTATLQAALALPSGVHSQPLRQCMPACDEVRQMM